MDQESDASGRLYAAILTYLELAERGDSPDGDALAADLADRPDLARELRDFAETYARVERLTAPQRKTMQCRAAPRSSPGAPGAAAAPGQVVRASGPGEDHDPGCLAPVTT